MYRIVKKDRLNPTVSRMVIEAPAVAKKALPGQFIILRVSEDGERIPLTVADYDREAGTVTITGRVNPLGAGISTVVGLASALNSREIVPSDKLQPLGLARSETIVSFNAAISRQLPVSEL